MQITPATLRGYSYSLETAQEYNRTGRLLYMRLETDHRCNLRCRYCYSQPTREKRPAPMPLSMAKNVVDQASELGVRSLVYLGGGEPIMYEDFWPLMEHLQRKSIVPAIFTNGTFVTRDVAARLADVGASVFAKLDTFNEKDQDFLTGKGTYRKFRRALDHLMDAGLNAVDPVGQTRLGLAMTPCKRGSSDIPEMWRFCRGSNIFPNVEPAVAKGAARRETVLSVEEIDHLREIVQGIDATEHGITWNSPTYTPIFGHDCWMSAASCGVHPDGTVGLCASLPSVGNVTYTPLRDIL